jgi:hypothetical protein
VTSRISIAYQPFCHCQELRWCSVCAPLGPGACGHELLKSPIPQREGCGPEGHPMCEERPDVLPCILVTRCRHPQDHTVRLCAYRLSFSAWPIRIKGASKDATFSVEGSFSLCRWLRLFESRELSCGTKVRCCGVMKRRRTGATRQTQSLKDDGSRTLPPPSSCAPSLFTSSFLPPCLKQEIVFFHWPHGPPWTTSCRAP